MGETSPSERLTRVLFYGFLALLAWLVFRVFEPFLAPLGWAAVLVVVFNPWHSRLAQHWGHRRGHRRAALVSTVGVTLILIVPALLLMTSFIRQGVEAARSIQHAAAAGQLDWLNRAWGWVQHHVPGESPQDLAALAKQGAERLGAGLAEGLGTVLRNVFVFLFDLAVTILALFYFFRDSDAIMAGLRRALPFDEPHRERMIGQARELIFASVISSLAVAAVHGLVGGLAFALVGIGAAVFWGVLMAFFSLVPLVGAWLIWVPAAVWLVVQGHIGRGVILVALCAVLVATVDNVLRPALISGRAQLSGLVVFISVLGGIQVFGMLGVVLGPIVVATAAGVLEVASRREPSEKVTPPHPSTAGKGPHPVLE